MLKIKFDRRLLFTTVLALNITFFSCENILDSIADCIINKRPSLPEQQLKAGYSGEYYYDELKASIINEPYDDDYYYYFKISGQLPVGIEVKEDGRTIIFEGITLETGIYHIKIYLNVESYYETDGLCDGSTYQEYTLVIE